MWCSSRYSLCYGSSIASAESLLFWLWTDLFVLFKLRLLRQSLKTDTAHSDDALHPDEEQDIVSHFQMKMDDVEHPTHRDVLKYQVLPSGELLLHAQVSPISSEKQTNSVLPASQQFGDVRVQRLSMPPTLLIGGILFMLITQNMTLIVTPSTQMSYLRVGHYGASVSRDFIIVLDS